MSEVQGERPTEGTPEDPLARRIRELRQQRGWSLAELAERAGLRSPSYVFHIENGDKIPRAPVARRLAAALGEDAELYGAWADLRGRADLRTALASAWKLYSSPEFRSQLARSEVAPLEATGTKPRSGPLDRFRALVYRDRSEESPTVHRDYRFRPLIPLIAEGKDPGVGEARRNAVGRLRFDPAMLEATAPVRERLASLVNPFAYRLTETNTRRARGLLAPGLYAVLTREVLPLSESGIYAVRRNAEVELGQVRWNGEHLLLLPGVDESDFVVIDASSEQALEQHIAGTIVVLLPEDAATISSWP